MEHGFDLEVCLKSCFLTESAGLLMWRDGDVWAVGIPAGRGKAAKVAGMAGEDEAATMAAYARLAAAPVDPDGADSMTEVSWRLVFDDGGDFSGSSAKAWHPMEGAIRTMTGYVMNGFSERGLGSAEEEMFRTARSLAQEAVLTGGVPAARTVRGAGKPGI